MLIPKKEREKLRIEQVLKVLQCKAEQEYRKKLSDKSASASSVEREWK
jgi:hypothetical protein